MSSSQKSRKRNQSPRTASPSNRTCSLHAWIASTWLPVLVRPHWSCTVHHRSPPSSCWSQWYQSNPKYQVHIALTVNLEEREGGEGCILATGSMRSCQNGRTVRQSEGKLRRCPSRPPPCASVCCPYQLLSLWVKSYFCVFFSFSVNLWWRNWRMISSLCSAKRRSILTRSYAAQSQVRHVNHPTP